jgi:hypothetical protein
MIVNPRVSATNFERNEAVSGLTNDINNKVARDPVTIEDVFPHRTFISAPFGGCLLGNTTQALMGQVSARNDSIDRYGISSHIVLLNK